VFRGAHIDAATRGGPEYAAAHVAPASRPLCALFFRFLFQSVRSFAGHAVTLPPDGNNATGRPIARGIEQAPRGGCSYPEGTVGHCPSLGDSAARAAERGVAPAPDIFRLENESSHGQRLSRSSSLLERCSPPASNDALNLKEILGAFHQGSCRRAIERVARF
jgi:hypothetical protein